MCGKQDCQWQAICNSISQSKIDNPIKIPNGSILSFSVIDPRLFLYGSHGSPILPLTIKQLLSDDKKVCFFQS